ncbi:heterokaryon incompatibility protein-domain-containing protein [Alternaria rosae]|uniref:heterokaryon incompatibility protein-domain-containing protein n=1 Tax=Alternaria rosae TaxID=1187941 RepID=UPI001E8DC1FB|nr:heterokaryon incompatibility protein-domain-containing protein [Alternaria rosae]KAH6878208.1 heterokaryon incompatibility protein-domain-containing protein [Alternaria rosae]
MPLDKPTHFYQPQISHSFRYRPLDPSEGEDIRLLCLYPGEFHEHIRCDLLHTNLDDDIEYEALSYTWASEDGDASLSQRIHCAYIGEEETSILPVTLSCASALRRLRSTSQERMLWVDALAIDQSNMRERNQQVSIMARIYSGASQVLVYLGEEDLGFGSRNLWLDTERRQVALKKLFAKRWASRVWVIQEAALAQKLVMVTGNTSCPMDTNLMSRIRGRAKISGLQIPGPLAWDPLVSAPTRDLLTMLHMTRNCSSTDPRDKVYGLLGLVGEHVQSLVPIDYTQSVDEVMTHAAAAIIICREDFEILSYASHKARPARHNLPTWVPDWTEWAGDITIRPQFQSAKIGPWKSLEKLMWNRPAAAQSNEIDWKSVVDIPASWPANIYSKPSIGVRAHCLATIDSATMQGVSESQRWQGAQDFGLSLKNLMDSDAEPRGFGMQSWPTRYRWLFDPHYTRLNQSQPRVTSAGDLHWIGLQQFCAELQSLGKDKRIFRAGYLPAVTSHEFEVGDTVWAVDGCTVPLILRPEYNVAPRMAGRRSFFIVGDCHLFALSHLDCWTTAGTGLDQRWDFDPFRHMDAMVAVSVIAFSGSFAIFHPGASTVRPRNAKTHQMTGAPCKHSDIKDFDAIRCCLSCGEVISASSLAAYVHTSEATALYKYKNLDHKLGRELRLVLLLPGNSEDALWCEIIHVDMDHDPEYDAVSYTWATEDGDSRLTKAIFCIQGGSVPITMNCDAVLRHLRQLGKRKLWVDAICIDQTNVSERNHQVGLMDLIYTNARAVYSCIDHTSNFSYLFRRLLGKSTQDYATSSALADLKSLFSLRYFTRVWVIQEVALARAAYLIVNDNVLPLTAAVIERMKKLGIVSCLHTTCTLQATDTRDHIYAVIGLMEEKAKSLIPVDYSLDRNVVYRNVVAAIIATRQNLEVLVFSRTDHLDPRGDWRAEPCLDMPALRSYLDSTMRSLTKRSERFTWPSHHEKHHVNTPWRKTIRVVILSPSKFRDASKYDHASGPANFVDFIRVKATQSFNYRQIRPLKNHDHATCFIETPQDAPSGLLPRLRYRPHDVRPDEADEIFAIDGAKEPFILRRAEGQQYRVVSACYLWAAWDLDCWNPGSKKGRWGPGVVRPTIEQTRMIEIY